MDAAFDIGLPGSEPVTLWWLDRTGSLHRIEVDRDAPGPRAFEQAVAARGALAAGRIEPDRKRGTVGVLPAGEAAAIHIGSLLDALDEHVPETRWFILEPESLLTQHDAA